MVANTYFMGIPVEGTPVKGHSNKEQYDIAGLIPYLQAVLSDPNVGKFGWRQYTPYFNDGDECIFSVGELWADPVNQEVNEGDDDYWDYREGIEWDKRWGKYDWRTKTYEGEMPETFRRLQQLADQIDSGHYEVACYDAFGDHVQVIFSNEKVVLETYDHD